MLNLVCYSQFCRPSNEEEQLRQEFTNSGKAVLMNYPDNSGVGEYQQQHQNERQSAGLNADSGTRNGSQNEFIQKVNLIIIYQGYGYIPVSYTHLRAHET